MKYEKEYEQYCYDKFDGDEDMVVEFFDDKKLYREFLEHRSEVRCAIIQYGRGDV